ncbi:MAG: SLBB domain-containing protein [Bacteroidales bacterium]|nr:SLBB domain-containing protein [Bacteroidales bacterium]
MTDQQVVDYYEQGIAQGKTKEAIAKELALRGVTREQAQRVASFYQNQNSTGTESPQTGERSHSTRPLPETALSAPESDEIADAEPDTVFGRDIFHNRDLNFSPSANMPTPPNYRLGPGDEVIIDIYGAAQQTIRETISPEGSIIVTYLGPVYLNGMTVEEANSFLRKKLSSIYSGLNQGGRSGTDIRLTLGQIRSIQVSVLGEVLRPGTYSVSSFATILHAIYQAGGIVEPGTLRNITVSRNGKTVGQADVYELLTTGSREHDIRLEDDDIILVKPYTEMVKINGLVKRPMFFEMKEGETVAHLLAYAGGFANGAQTANVSVIRQRGKSFEVKTVESADFPTFVLQDGDEVTVGRLQSRFENRISISGAVYFPGVYERSDQLRSVRQLVAKAGGLLPEAFTNRAVVHREHDDRTLEVLAINLGRVLDGSAPDFMLRNNDELIVASKDKLDDPGTMSISGLVARPGIFPFAENTTVEDLIIMAGGLQSGASVSRVDVSRRQKDTKSLSAGNELSELYCFAIKDGLIVDGEGGFILEPYDEVVVHKSPAYNAQAHFNVTGQVNFPGTYSLTGRQERLSDAIRKAGGLTAFSSAKSARLTRTLSASELRQHDEAEEALLQVGDSTITLETTHQDVIQVAISLDKALANPGGEYDILIRENDVLEIPMQSNTVQTRGAVMAPSALTYVPGRAAAYYIRKSGGFADRASRAHAYIIRANGNKRPLHAWTQVLAGDELVVPLKEKKKTDANGTILTLSSTAASLATMTVAIMSVINQSKGK